MIYNIIGTGLYFYFQSVIFLPAIAISIFMSIARVWDAINDPMMGTIVDRTRTKWGKCRPYLIFSPPIICIITILTFVNGMYGHDNSSAKNALIIGWAAVSYILWGMNYTVGDIPLWGITALITEDDKDRAKLLALARIFAGIGGGLVLVAIVPASQALGKALESVTLSADAAQQRAFIIVSIVLSVIGCGLFELAGLFTKERVAISEESHTMKENFKMMWANKPFRQQLISGILRSPVSLLMNIAMTLLAYYYGNYYGNYTKYLIILGGGIFIGQFIVMAVTPKLAAKYEKKNLLIIATLISATAFALVFAVYLIAPLDLDKPVWMACLAVLFAVAGGGQGALNVLQSVMIADAVDYEEYMNGIRPDGVFFSGQSFITKLSAGIASIISGAVYAIIGFSDVNVQAVNNALRAGASFKADYPKYAMAMFLLCSIPPAIGLLLSVLPLRRYALSDSEHSRILDELNQKRHNESDAE
ncbi:MAG: Melibiose carrier protein [Firmicutes bacterium ADurb.Bin300]|nr:MAG: Melibiose carrier protein [Firmicutes bacterium ADurb.Bin300]